MTINAETLYENMKDMYSITALLDKIDNKADLKGIFILLVAQAKLATKASIDKAPTSKTAFTEDKKFMASVYPLLQ